MSCRRILVASILALSASLAQAQGVDLTPEKARVVLHNHCAACHDGANPRGVRRLFDPNKLAEVITPKDPHGSELLQLVESGMMPRGTRTKVPTEDVQHLRDWIAAGAKPFAPTTSDEYALRYILLDQRSGEGTARDRYFAFNHLLTADPNDPVLFAEALTTALNLLSGRPEVVRPVAIDPARTVFRVDLGRLGWDVQPFESKTPGEMEPGKSPINLFDLVLLEYPHAALPVTSAEFYAVDLEYMQRANLVRPIPFVRGDWFIGAAGRPPLYEDLLRLPLSLASLEQKFNIETADRTRAGLTTSTVLNVPRLTERRTAGERVYWRSYELRGAKGLEDVLTAADTTSGAGEVLFALPNGLPGFFTAGGNGFRSDGVPADLWKDKERPRTGFACLRCHSSGVVPPTDVIVAALDSATLPEAKKRDLRKWYPGRVAIENGAKADNNRFAAAWARLESERLPPAWAKLGKTIPERSALEEVVRRARVPGTVPPGVATPLPPLDGLMLNERPRDPPLVVEVTHFKADNTDAKPEKVTALKPDYKFFVSLKNESTVDLHIELLSIDKHGKISALPLPRTPMEVKAGKELRIPSGKMVFMADKELGTSRLVLFASDSPFIPATVLSVPVKPGTIDFVNDRFLHRFVDKAGDGRSRFNLNCDPRRMMKRTFEIETQAP